MLVVLPERGDEIEADALGAAQHVHQRVVDDLDDLLARGDGAQHAGADSLLGYLVDEAAHHRQGNIGLQQGDAHFAHGIANVLFFQRAATTQLVEDATEANRQTVEHATRLLGPHSRRNAKNAGGRNLADRRSTICLQRTSR